MDSQQQVSHINWMVCHDGSKSSCSALTEVFNNLLGHDDTLMVAHIFNQEKEKYLKFDLKKDYIRGMCEAECISLGDRYFYAEDEHNDKHHDSIKHHLNVYAKEREIDIMVVGFHGRKGPKADNTFMGTAVTYLSMEAVCPVLIVKDH